MLSCFQRAIAMCELFSSRYMLIPLRKSVNDILTPIRQASNYLFIFLPEISIFFLFCFDECALILQPNLKVSVNSLDKQPEMKMTTRASPRRYGHIPSLPRSFELEGISCAWMCLTCDPLREE